MILANLAKAIREQNYYAVVLEFLIVIAGVVIGFQITAWNEDRHDQEVTADYIARFQDDLETIRSEMQNRMAYADWVRSHLARTIRALRYEDADLGSEFIVDAYISAHGVGARIRIDTIDEILSTGSFGKIKDQELRQEIMRFNRVTQEAQFILDRESDYQSRYRQAMPIETIMLLRQNCAGAPVLDDRGIATFQIPPSCPPDLTPEQVTETIVSLKGADLLPILREALSDIETKRNRFQQVYEVAGEIAITLEPMN